MLVGPIAPRGPSPRCRRGRADLNCGAGDGMGARRTHRAAVSPATADGRELSGLVIDLDAPIVVCHSEKEQAVPTVKETFEYHPMLASCNNTDAFLVAVLRRGNAGSNTAATTSPCSTPPSPSFATPTATACRSWSGPTLPAPPGSSSLRPQPPRRWSRELAHRAGHVARDAQLQRRCRHRAAGGADEQLRHRHRPGRALGVGSQRPADPQPPRRHGRGDPGRDRSRAPVVSNARPT